MPYSSDATRQAMTAQPEPPGLNADSWPLLFHASQATPPKPITRPSTRAGLSLSFSHHHATAAPNSGDAALKIADRPAVIDSAAYAKHRNGSAEFVRPTTKIGRQRLRSTRPPHRVTDPSLPTTRWHGTITESGWRPTAPPTARTADAAPSDFAIAPYVLVWPSGIASSAFHTLRWNGVPCRSSGTSK